MHDNCVHYQYIGGRMVEVGKDDWYDYCTDEDDVLDNPSDDGYLNPDGTVGDTPVFDSPAPGYPFRS